MQNIYKVTEMEEQELIEVKRAHNFIWTAAEKYELNQCFLHFPRMEQQICI